MIKIVAGLSNPNIKKITQIAINETEDYTDEEVLLGTVVMILNDPDEYGLTQKELFDALQEMKFIFSDLTRNVFEQFAEFIVEDFVDGLEAGKIKITEK